MGSDVIINSGLIITINNNVICNHAVKHIILSSFTRYAVDVPVSIAPISGQYMFIYRQPFMAIFCINGKIMVKKIHKPTIKVLWITSF